MTYFKELRVFLGVAQIMMFSMSGTPGFPDFPPFDVLHHPLTGDAQILWGQMMVSL